MRIPNQSVGISRRASATPVRAGVVPSRITKLAMGIPEFLIAGETVVDGVVKHFICFADCRTECPRYGPCSWVCEWSCDYF
jgi:hypothetical protein